MVADDVIVVGAGLGGLAAAATLARAGRGVRLFERHVQPGGYATTFVRGRFEFEVSLHALSGIG
ncbi:MAG: FAD-dependent oxidoreductase, partial [Myxococcota bacterium]